MIRDAFAAKTVLVTGATGFLGKAVVEKLLRSCPEVAEIRLLIRPLPGRSATERLETRILGANAFDRLREELGPDGFAKAASKLVAVEADLEAEGLGLEDLSMLSGLDLVLHCAASVDFDLPLDDALSVNVGGTVGLLRALKQVASLPVIVHVSTAYVAGLRRGIVLELEPGKPGKSVSLDWQEEASAAAAVRSRVGEESRSPERAAEFLERAEGELGPSGRVSVARRAEEFRKRWVDQTLVDRGRQRAQALGWPDVYTLTKALAERHLLSEAKGARLAVVRPAIIEAAAVEPEPGWIEGLKVAEPIILAYAQGQLNEFTGRPETVLDLIPVDYVANAVLAAAASLVTADSPARPVFYAASTGNRNPLHYGDAFSMMARYFEEHPLLDGDGRPIRAGEWSYPGQRKLDRRLSVAKRVVELGEKWINKAPGIGPIPALLNRLVTLEGQVDQASKLSRMYGSYTELDCVFDDTNTRALWDSLPSEDQETFPFDVDAIDWKVYWQDTHLPAVSKTFGRWFSGRSLERNTVPPLAGGDGQSHVLAAFDIEGTIVDATIVHYYAWLRLRDMGPVQGPLWLALFASKLPGYLALDHKSRTEFNRRFYRNYRGLAVDDVRAKAREAFGAVTVPRLFPEAIRRIREHKARGHQVLLITGAADFLVEPLRTLADDVIAARLEESRGLFTGEMRETPLTGEARSSMVAAYARDHGCDLAKSWAYADSLADLPMLEAVGHPVAVNPDHRLGRTARRRRWPVLTWETEPGGAGLGSPLARAEA